MASHSSFYSQPIDSDIYFRKNWKDEFRHESDAFDQVRSEHTHAQYCVVKSSAGSVTGSNRNLENLWFWLFSTANQTTWTVTMTTIKPPIASKYWKDISVRFNMEKLCAVQKSFWMPAHRTEWYNHIIFFKMCIVTVFHNAFIHLFVCL